jgi:pimeloyl-ACP methyl ester carboxylesterase
MTSTVEAEPGEGPDDLGAAAPVGAVDPAVAEGLVDGLLAATPGPGAGTDPARVAGAQVVFLHGQPGDATTWDPVLDLLDGRGLRMLAVDRPGYGDARADAGGFAHNAAVLLDVLGHAGGPVVVVAHSWAAGPALIAARLAPELVAGLVLCAPVGDPRSVTVLDRVLARGPVGRAVLRAGLAVGGWLVRLPGGEHLLPLAGLGHLSPTRARTATQPALDRRARRAAAIEQIALVDELVEVRRAARRVQAPTVVIGGTHDGIVRPQAVRGLARAVPAARLEMVDGGHLLPSEHPEVVAAAVLGLLDPPPVG